MIPNYITHYYLKDREPFLSLSDLHGDTSNPIFIELLNKHKSDPLYRRRYGKSYLGMRKDAEQKLKKLFIERGGLPTRKYPHYCVLGKSEWFKHLNENHTSLEVLIKDLPLESVSLTFPDSFVAMTQKTKPYYEKIFLLNELNELIDLYGLPNDDVPSNYDKYWEGGFEKYIEVQIWDDKVTRLFKSI